MVDTRARLVVAVPKDKPLQHLGYMTIVRGLPCARCKSSQWRSQFCHADILGRGGKGKGLRSDCRLGWPGCRECHWFVGTSGKMTKTERHAFEAAAGVSTRAAVIAAGLWPARLPRWPGDGA